jgi:hypothetical protein
LFDAKEAFDSVLLTLEDFPSAHYWGPSEHIKFLLVGHQIEFITLSFNNKFQVSSVALDLSGIGQESVSSTAALVN